MATAYTTKWVALEDLRPVNEARGYTDGACSHCPSRHNFVVQAWSTDQGCYVDTRFGGHSIPLAEKAERKLRNDKSRWMRGITTGTRVVKAKSKIS